MKVTQEEFYTIKKQLRWSTVRSVAKKRDRHLSTIININGCKTYSDYTELVKAEHPKTEFSLKEQVLELHKFVFDVGDSKYFAPRTARVALVDLLTVARAEKESGSHQ